MDPLTHLAIPLTVAYVLRPDLFPDARYLAITVFGILPDFDKFLGVPGLFHSLLLTIPFSTVFYVVGRRLDATEYALLAVALLHAHLLLDVLDGGSVTLLFPLVERGVGLTYPTHLVLDGPVGATVERPLPELRVTTTRPGRTRYPLVNGFGVLSVLTFATVYLGTRHVRGSEDLTR